MQTLLTTTMEACADVCEEFSGNLLGFDDFVSTYAKRLYAFVAPKVDKYGRYGARGCDRIVR
jgi:hypothetical protein